MKRWGGATTLAVLTFIVVMVSQKDHGIARDEVVYMHHGSRYASYFVHLLGSEPGILSKKSITAAFGGPGATDGNREHPPLMKTLFGLSEYLFHQKIPITGRISAYRLPSAAIAGVLSAALYLFVAAHWGFACGFFASLLLLLMPRFLFYSGLAAFDGPIAAMWMFSLMSYYQGLRSRRWAIAAGLLWGIALATKHNALLLPLVMTPHYAWFLTKGRAQTDPATEQRGNIARLRSSIQKPHVMLPISIAFLGPLTLFVLWPWLWISPFQHVGEWISFHFHHVHYNFEYLGRNWNAAPYPWHVPLVTLLFTVPVATLLAALLGVGQVIADVRCGRNIEIGILLLLSVIVAVGPFIIGRAPIFGAEKHFASALPAIAVFAGLGITWAVRLTRNGLRRLALGRRLALTALGGSVALAAATETFAAHAYPLSHYNALAGGAKGGADLGMNRQFWGYAARGVLPYLNQVGGNGLVYTHDAAPAWNLYRQEGWIRQGLKDAGPETHGIDRSTFAIVVHERHFNRHDYLIWNAYGSPQPSFVLTFQGVPLVSVYRKGPSGSNRQPEVLTP